MIWTSTFTFNLGHSQGLGHGQGLGHVHFDCEYHTNGYRESITIAIKWEVIYLLLIGIFSFDLSPF